MILVLSTLWLLLGAAGQSVPDQRAVEEPSSTVEVYNSVELATAVRNQTVQLIRVGFQTLQVRHMYEMCIQKLSALSVLLVYVFQPPQVRHQMHMQPFTTFYKLLPVECFGIQIEMWLRYRRALLNSPFGCHALMGERHSANTHTDA
jgi:hypothetical protein